MVYIPCKDNFEARKISEQLILEKLIACSNIFPVSSMYMWNQVLSDDQEFVIIGKTIADKYKEIIKKVKQLHSYKVPAIVKINIETNKEYEKWLRQELN